MEAQENKDYSFENAVDVYAFYYLVSTIVCLVGIALQIKNLINRFLTKRQVIILAVLVGLFQAGILFLSLLLAL